MIRSQHLLYRDAQLAASESLSKDCGWKEGDRGGSVKRLGSTERNIKTVLTQTGLLMEGLRSDIPGPQ